MNNRRSKKDLVKRTAKLEKELAARSYELKVESALEKVSIAAMSMRRSKDLSGIGSLIFKELKKLGFTDLRNTEIIINNDAEETITSYYYSDYGVTGVIELDYRSNPIVRGWAKKMKKASAAFAKVIIREKEMKQWRKYREEIGYQPDPKLNKAKTVYYYSYSIGLGALSISSFKPVSKEQIEVLGRLRNVFNLSYRRYADIVLAEAHAREAQIEAALERVRASSMAMHRSDELDKVIKEVTEQLTLLGFDYDASNITTDLTSAGLYVWNASPAQPIPSGVYIPYKDIDIINWIYSDWGVHEGVKTDTFNKVQKNAFFKHYFTHTDARNISDERKKYILDAKSLNFTFACRKDFALGLLNYRGIIYTEEQNNILARFSKVFEQSYTRFLDLQKAEEQARESQIQLALERVRARTMAMQKSDELVEAASVMFQQLTNLGIKNTASGFALLDPNDKIGDTYTAANGTVLPYKVTMRYDLSAPLNKVYDAWKEGKEFLINDISGKELEENNRAIAVYMQQTYGPEMFSKIMEFNESNIQPEVRDRIVSHHVYFSQGMIVVGYHKPIEEVDVLIRFAKVFEQTYTRFLDLQKAETQAREAQIELGLERVRVRAMTMHSSDELNDLVKTLFEELIRLDVKLATCLISTFDISTLDETSWMFHPITREPYVKRISYNEQPFYHEMLRAWKERNAAWNYCLEGEAKVKWHEFLFADTEFALLPQSVKDEMQRPDKVFFTASYYNYGAIQAASLEPFPAQSIDIIQRFSKVFDLSYTRFLDLQKAEAQARESQIQLALERVRARSLAMHHTSELQEVVNIVAQQLHNMNIDINGGVFIAINDEVDKDIPLWASGGAADYVQKVTVPFLNSPVFITLRDAIKRKNNFFTEEHSYEEKIGLFEHLFKYPPWNSLSQQRKQELLSREGGYARSVAVSNHTSIAITNHKGKKFSDDDNEILERFGNVFEQSYTRFLDLQKAEAQAREAQIEAALERVRGRTMAMHNSNDVGETVVTMFDEVIRLGIHSIRCGIGIFGDTTRMEVWTAKEGADGKPERVIGHLDMTRHPLLQGVYNTWKNKEKHYAYELAGNDLINYFNIINSDTEYPIQYEIDSLPSKQFHNSFFFPEGVVYVFSSDELSEGAEKIFKRFAGVFGQTYRRYLDLQKAEAQAREAQVESALEKVRSRSLAMHKSDELQEVVNTVFERLKELNIEMDSANIAIFKEGTRDYDYWIASPVQKRSAVFHMPYIDSGIAKDLMDIRESKAELFTRTYSFEQKNEWFERSFQKTDFKFLDDQRKKFILDAEGITVAIAFAKNTGVQVNRYSSKSLAEAEIDILKRFSKVFEQAYIRFLDLQKAEAQAREAQIETSLERVRSKTMAMHNSNDVGETVATMFAEFVYLGIHTNRCGILIFNDQYTAEVWTARSTPGGNAKLIIGKLDLDAHKMLRSVFSAWKAKGTFYQYDLLDNDLVQYYTAINNSKFYPTQFDLNALPQKEFHSDFFFADGAVFSFTNEPVVEEHAKIIKRFALVFGQTYRRYLDLQKAEAQAREAQIEAALERVRARTMAMHRSEELSESSAVLFHELHRLGIQTIRSGFGIYDEPDQAIQLWLTASSGEEEQKNVVGRIPIHAHPAVYENYIAWKEKAPMLVHEFELEQVKDYYQKIGNYLSLAPQSSYPDRLVFSVFFFSEGSLHVMSDKPLLENECAIMLRFANVFGLTYRRFRDLKQAEAQAREAQIESSLERVRSKTMAMHSSDDVTSATATMFTELERLGIENMRCGIVHFLEDHKMEVWSVSNLADGKVVKGAALMDTNSIPFWKIFYSTWQKKEDFLYYYMAGKEKEDYFKKISTVQNYLSQSIEDVPDLSIQTYYFPEGCVWAFSLKPHSEEDKQVMKRFASVFSLTFRRYQDLKKAEAQAREATIEAALEKVRSSAMAMHSSNDISSTTTVVFEELRKLNIHSKRCGVALLSKDSHTCQVYAAATSSDGKFHTLRRSIEMTQHHSLEQQYESWIKQENYVVEMAGEELRSYYQLPFFYSSPDYVPPTNYEHTEYGYYIPFSEGLFYAWTEEPYLEDEINILNRFKRIVDLTFRRYFDLQKAEAQAREATIEAALEKVRGKAMAMHNSNDLSVTASLVFTELRKLGINPIRCGVGLLNKESRKAQLYSATVSSDGDSLSLVGWVMLSKHPVAEKIYDTWLANEDYYPELGGEQLRSYYENLLSGLSLPSVPDGETGQKQFGTFLPFSVGCLYAWSEAPYNEAEIKILKRFATIIDLTFRRYTELQTSEANARDAVKQAALDRIRADIASMRTVADLDRITPLIWSELTVLGIPFIRCGVFIMDEAQHLIHTFLSTPEGKAIAAFHMPYDTPGNFADMLIHWKNKKTYTSHWGEADMMGMADILVKQGAIATKEQYLSSLPASGFYLHFLPFLQGMLYVGSLEKLNDEQIELIEHVADAFSTAYARYEDFNRLEAAKQQVEKTLTDLKLAQTQLVQSEKMASLGELTAGIAHEIQNPLNFVNNFSEVSNELLEEMKVELEKGNNEDALAIAEDVKQNLEKINHHGKRADGIVKGMLQHSRTSSGQKETTDINALADEYLRLAYHGLRAKDKSFNAKFETEFDKNVGEINIIPQEIGRVILNLINNAFYAVSEKKRQKQEGYEPTVTLTTVKDNGKIEIKVKDNGNGITQKVLEKIFQPFFTTKPTGQGTGLGLSLAYDIVKAHGGEIKVETKEGNGSEFVIQLPV